MQVPDMNNVWETFIRISPDENVINAIRSRIRPLIFHLRDEGLIGWYHFLIHNQKSGVPTSDDDTAAYFHIRFEVKGADVNEILPAYCVMTRKHAPESIYGIDKTLLKNEQIEEAWRVIGDQSEWVLNMLAIHKDDAEIPSKQIAQFMHYYSNMLQLAAKCPNCGTTIPL
jgi:hypothetical protein